MFELNRATTAEEVNALFAAAAAPGSPLAGILGYEPLPLVSTYNPLAQLKTHAQQMPEKTAIVDGSAAWNYAQLWAGVEQVAAQLAGRGAGEGDIVAVYAPRCAQLPLALLALPR